MNNNTIQLKGNPLQAWHGPLSREGFRPLGDAYVRDGVAAECADNWFVLKAAGREPVSPAALQQLGQAGFWKLVHEAQGAMNLFEFPRAAVTADDEADPAGANPDTSLTAFLRWAMATRANAIPADWRPPTPELLNAWMPAGALTVQCGPIVRQGELILTPRRWALRFPILPVLPAGLPVARRQWLHQLLVQAQQTWRMVRVGITDDSENPAAVAELDFTGAPHSEYLFLAGLAGVRHVVAWLAESVELVADASVASQALAIHPPSNPKTGRNTT